MGSFRVLHTSDWHLGHQLYRKRRDDEFLAFLQWLEKLIGEKKVDALVISGDVFDSPLPGPAIQKMYYDFLLKAARAGARHIVVTAGNHDSPALLTAASPLLAQLQIHVVGVISADPENEIRVLRNECGEPEMIVCAVPYIRERDARESIAGESQDEKEANLRGGIRDYYRRIGEIAGRLACAPREKIPVLATGHLFAAEAKTTDEERNLYIGSLGQLPVDIFPPVFDYVALGHIHRAQIVGGRENARYSGSPLAMSFAEARYQKQVILLEFGGVSPTITPIPVPAFRQLADIRGDKAGILERLAALRRTVAHDAPPVWIEIQHDGSEDPTNLQDLINECVQDSPLRVLCVKTDYRRPGMERTQDYVNLENLSPEDVFHMRLADSNKPENEKNDLLQTWRELILELRESKKPGGDAACAS